MDDENLIENNFLNIYISLAEFEERFLDPARIIGMNIVFLDDND